MPVLFVIVFIDLLGFGLFIPLLPFYAEAFGADPFRVGLVMATYSLTQFLFAPYWGHLSDRVGRRPVLLLTLAGTAAAYVWLGFADALWAMFAARAVGGAMAGNIATAFAYVADVTTRDDRTRGMGLIGAAFGLGFIAGPALGGILAGSDPVSADFRTPALTAAGLSFAAWCLAIPMLKESLSAEARQRLASEKPRGRWLMLRAALERPDVGLLIGLSFLTTFVFAGLETTFAMWSRRQYGWGPEQNGYMFAGVGLLSAVVQGGLIGRLAARFGEGRLIVHGAVALAVGVAMIPFAEHLPLLLAAMAMAGFGFSIITPSLTSRVSLGVDEGDQGGVLGVTRAATTLARVLGPAWAGLLFSVLGKDWPYFGGAAIMVAVALLGVRLLKGSARHRRRS